MIISLLTLLAITRIAQTGVIAPSLAWTGRTFLTQLPLILSAFLAALCIRTALAHILLQTTLSLPALPANLLGSLGSWTFTILSIVTDITFTGLAYLAFAPKPSPLGSLEKGDYWRLAFVAMLFLAVMALIIISLATSTALLASWVPGFQKMAMWVFGI
jgi:hypothetical protein